jgi:uncharacterized membrane protein YtjA (UPF0391 family)
MDPGTIGVAVAILALLVSILNMSDSAVGRLKRAWPHVARWGHRVFLIVAMGNSIVGVVGFLNAEGAPSRVAIGVFCLHIVLLLLLPSLTAVSAFIDRMKDADRSLDRVIERLELRSGQKIDGKSV